MSSISSSAHQTPSEPHVPCHHNNDREVRSSVPPADWVNHTTSVTEGTAQSHFEFFYQVIFTFVHSALTLLLAPVLKNTRPRSSSRRSSSSQRSRTQRRDTPQSFHPREVDPELAMPPHMTPENTRVGSSASNSSSILKSQRRRRSSGEQPPHQAAMTAQAAATAKSVRFPEPIRSRPPLGRISSSIGGVASSANISVGESSSTGSSSSASSRNGRGRMAPRYTQRAHHTTYFLSD